MAFGKVSEFSTTKPDTWPQYKVRFSFFVETNKITNAKHYEELIQVLDSLFNPNKNEIALCLVFENRKQQSTEIIVEFKQLSRECNFQDLGKQFLICIVCGVKYERLQHQLLLESILTFDTAVKISAAFEVANRNVETISAAQNEFKHDCEGRCSKLENLQEYTKNSKCQVSSARNDVAITRFWCGVVGHEVPECRHKILFVQDILGGYAAVAEVLGAQRQRNQMCVTLILGGSEESTRDNEDHYGTLFYVNLGIDQVQVYKVSLQLNEKPHEFEIDSGAALTIVNHDVFIKLWPDVKKRPVLQPSKHFGSVYGDVSVKVNFKGKCSVQKLIMADYAGKSLLGINWFEDLGISVLDIHRIEDDSSILKEYEPLFHEEGFPPLKVPPVHIKLKTDAEPKFLKALCTRVHEALDMLVKERVLEPTTFSSWATPVVQVIRISADYSNTVTTCVQQNVFPLPTIQELFANLGCSKVFSKLDVKQAYLQLLGLVCVRRLPQGLSAAPGTFQHFIAQLLSGLQGVPVFLYDIEIAGSSGQEHAERLKEVLHRMIEGTVNLEWPQVHFLGFIVNKARVQPDGEKFHAIHEAPEPKNKTELKAFLELLNFYASFLKGKANIVEPLHRLLNGNTTWNFVRTEMETFQNCTTLLHATSVITLALCAGTHGIAGGAA
ncbi:hypothetical protein PR048_020473 [Dryococelus australis]|uniref:Uncharacterized protein n=1 Tax=Dryococelus australis TaxID=614101 RepID=A0ABQ9H6D7_9NEOP|nr:hypothetical protein PR048_020473 [Dryococelus australis]